MVGGGGRGCRQSWGGVGARGMPGVSPRLNTITKDSHTSNSFNKINAGCIFSKSFKDKTMKTSRAKILFSQYYNFLISTLVVVSKFLSFVFIVSFKT